MSWTYLWQYGRHCRFLVLEVQVCSCRGNQRGDGLSVSSLVTAPAAILPLAQPTVPLVESRSHVTWGHRSVPSLSFNRTRSSVLPFLTLLSDWSSDAFKWFPLPHLRPARSWPTVLDDWNWLKKKRPKCRKDRLTKRRPGWKIKYSESEQERAKSRISSRRGGRACVRRVCMFVHTGGLGPAKPTLHPHLPLDSIIILASLEALTFSLSLFDLIVMTQFFQNINTDLIFLKSGNNICCSVWWNTSFFLLY